MRFIRGGYPSERRFHCTYFALSVCNSVTYPGTSQVFNSGFQCSWKRQDSSVSIVTSGEFKGYCLSLSRDKYFSIRHGETDLEAGPLSLLPSGLFSRGNRGQGLKMISHLHLMLNGLECLVALTFVPIRLEA